MGVRSRTHLPGRGWKRYSWREIHHCTIHGLGNGGRSCAWRRWLESPYPWGAIRNVFPEANYPERFDVRFPEATLVGDHQFFSSFPECLDENHPAMYPNPQADCLSPQEKPYLTELFGMALGECILTKFRNKRATRR